MNAANDNVAKLTKATKFQVGHTYTCRSICDYDCIFSFEVVGRSAKSVQIKYHGKVSRRGVREYDGVEICSPLGRFSMSPIISADRFAD